MLIIFPVIQLENSCMWVEIGTATMENSMEVSQKTKTEPPYNPEIPLLGIHPETKTLI